MGGAMEIGRTEDVIRSLQMRIADLEQRATVAERKAADWKQVADTLRKQYQIRDERLSKWEKLFELDDPLGANAVEMFAERCIEMEKVIDQMRDALAQSLMMYTYGAVAQRSIDIKDRVNVVADDVQQVKEVAEGTLKEAREVSEQINEAIRLADKVLGREE